MRLIIAVVASALVAGSAYAQAVVDSSDAPLDTSVVKAAMNAATKDLKAPMSAKFRGLRLIHTSRDRPDVICGYVNAKNGFGGYVGFKPFYFDVKKNAGGVLSLPKTDISYPIQRLPFE